MLLFFVNWTKLKYTRGKALNQADSCLGSARAATIPLLPDLSCTTSANGQSISGERGFIFQEGAMGECPNFLHAWWSYVYACELARAHMCCTEQQHKLRGVERDSLEMQNLRGGMRALSE